MRPEYIGIGNFDEYNYVYAYCKCPLPVDYAIKWPRIKDGKVHSYTCTCEECGTEVGVVSKSYGPEVLSKEPCTDAISREVLDRIKNELHATAEKHEDGVYYLRDEWIDEVFDKYKDKNATIREDDKCQSCEKDWTKCGTCPVMMKRVKEMKDES